MERLTISPADPDSRVLAAAARALSQGGLVVFPTDTLYGLAADPRSVMAVERVFQLKGRSAVQALPLIADSLEQVEACLGPLAGRSRRLAERFWPGPLTLVVDGGAAVVPAVRGDGGTVAVRVPAHAVARGLSAGLRFPVVSTSANRSGGPAPATADEALAQLGESIEIVLDAGPVAGGEPSTIVDARGGEVTLVRAGAVPFSLVRETP